MIARRKPTLTPDEALQLHYEALVVDAQQPPATTGLLFTERMHLALSDYLGSSTERKFRDEIAPLLEAMAVREIRTSEEARQAYVWTYGVNLGSRWPAAATLAQSPLAKRSRDPPER